jgi:hypothetical protein
MKKYKHKLNMLEPGSRMLKLIGILLFISIVLRLLKIIILFAIFVGMAILTGAILFVLLLIEQHQDKVLNDQVINERKKHGEDWNG